MHSIPTQPRKNRRPFRLLAGFMLMILIAALPARAADSDTMIRDDEIEHMLKSWIRPVIVADGLDPDAVRIILVQSPEINSFVAGGQNIFIYSGLLLKSDNAGEVVGVLSHELGHIAGGHLIRGQREMENASFEALLGSLVGIGAAVLSHQGGAAAAIGGASSSMAMNNYLAFSRVQESSADQAGLAGMQRAHLNPTGLLTFMQKLESEELLPQGQQSAYVRTHPLSRDRVQALQDGLARSPFKNDPLPASWADQHARMKAKLLAFISPAQVAWTYNDRDQSIPARYARAIAAYRQNQVQQALSLMDGLLKSEPNNPYFMELKGQMLVDFGRVKDAMPYYRKAVALAPDAGLIRIAYAGSLLETAGNDHAQLQQAIEQLNRATRIEPRSILAQHLLATAYGRMEQEPVAKLHLAEEGALKGDWGFAREQAKEALDGLKPNSPDWQVARDLMDLINRADKGGDKRERNR